MFGTTTIGSIGGYGSSTGGNGGYTTGHAAPQVSHSKKFRNGVHSKECRCPQCTLGVYKNREVMMAAKRRQNRACDPAAGEAMGTHVMAAPAYQQPALNFAAPQIQAPVFEQEGIAATTDEIAALQKSIVALDKTEPPRMTALPALSSHLDLEDPFATSQDLDELMVNTASSTLAEERSRDKRTSREAALDACRENIDACFREVTRLARSRSRSRGSSQEDAEKKMLKKEIMNLKSKNQQLFADNQFMFQEMKRLHEALGRR